MSTAQTQLSEVSEQVSRLKENRPELFLTADEFIADGDQKLESQQYEAALSAYDRALEVQPGNADLWFNRSRALTELNKKDEALAALNEVTRLSPDNNEAWYQIGLLLREQRRYEEALSAFDKVIEADPTDAKSWLNRGDGAEPVAEKGRGDRRLRSGH